jgi:ABC-2 type transport system ATP-binding protein
MEIVEINSIRKEFGTTVAVNNLSLSIRKGQVVGLIGPNGAGKTTLLQILATVLTPTAGTAQLLGFNLSTDYLEVRKHIGYMPDFFNLYSDLTICECLEFFAHAYKVEPSIIPERMDRVLEYVGLGEKRNDFIRHLSRGMIQRMGVAVSLIHDPDVFLLDEPASGLDPKARIQLRNILKRLSSDGKTIVISSHILTELSGFCSHIAIMDKGKLVLFGAVNEIQQKITDSRKIAISVLNDCDKTAAIIKGFPNTEVISAVNNTVTFAIKASLPELAELNRVLVEQGIRVFNFQEEKAGIEDLFMKISSEE